MDTPGDLSDDELLARLRSHVSEGNVWLAELIAYLNEAEDRRLDRIHACPSMWELCTTKLGMSPSEAQRRIVAARLVRKFRQVLGHIERGEIHRCALYAMRGHLTVENVDELLGAALGKSTREVEKMIAARYPRPDVPPSIELVAPQEPLLVAAPSAPSGPTPRGRCRLPRRPRPNRVPVRGSSRSPRGGTGWSSRCRPRRMRSSNGSRT